MTEEEKKMLEKAKEISNYCKGRKCSDCIFSEKPEKPSPWCTLCRIPPRWTEHIEKKEE